MIMMILNSLFLLLNLFLHLQKNLQYGIEKQLEFLNMKCIEKQLIFFYQEMKLFLEIIFQMILNLSLLIIKAIYKLNC